MVGIAECERLSLFVLQWRSELDEIINMAQDDTDQWVAVVANILKTFPSTGSLNTEIDEHHNFFHEALNDLKKLGDCNATFQIAHAIV